MSLNLDLVGTSTGALEHEYTWKDCVIYALGVGAKVDAELDFLFEMNGPRVLPTFAVVPSFQCLVDVCGKLRANPMMIVHGEQTVILHKLIPPSGTFSTDAVVTGIYDKGKGALAVVEAKTVDDRGEPVFDNIFSVFVRGAGGFGGERGPEAVAADPPEGKKPDFTFTERTSPDQAALYRLSGDLNPLHISPQMAKMGKLDRPILHGLCTYGFAGRAILREACGGDPARFKRFSARFTAMVLPGDELTTTGWEVEPGRYVIRVTRDDGTIVLGNSIAEIAPA